MSKSIDTAHELATLLLRVLELEALVKMMAETLMIVENYSNDPHVVMEARTCLDAYRKTIENDN